MTEELAEGLYWIELKPKGGKSFWSIGRYHDHQMDALSMLISDMPITRVGPFIGDESELTHPITPRPTRPRNGIRQGNVWRVYKPATPEVQ